ncbi:MAG: DUF2958 domain-containing protein [Afipia felis]|nr:DUF2958 domain-containing protein [Afipia felis]
MTVDLVPLLTVTDRVKLLAQALAGDRDHAPVVKLTMASAGAAWLLSECDPDDPDRCFGLCDLGLGSPELGYVDLRELLTVSAELNLPIERDANFATDKPLSLFAEEARSMGQIVT